MKTVNKNGCEYMVLATFQDVEVQAMKDLAFVTDGALKVGIIDGVEVDEVKYNLCEAYKDSGSEDYFYYAYPVFIY
jgi:hypothetical protein